MSDLIQGLRALDYALPAYEEAKRFYDGQSNEKFQSAALQRALGSKDSTFNFNYSRLVIESRLNRMEIAAVATEDGSADDFLAEMWNRNQLDTELMDAIEGALVFGDSYLIAGEGDEGVDVFYNDPRSTRVFYDVENPRKKKFALKRWMDGDKLRVNLYYADRIEKYISKSKPNSTMDEQDFEAYFDEDSNAWPLVNDSGKIPVFHLRTSRQYGAPEHKQSYGPQSAITKLLNTQISSIDFSTAPQRYFLQDPSANDGVDPNSDFGTGLAPDDDDDIVSNLKAGPGGVWNLKGIASVGQFDAPSPDTFVVPFKNFIEAMSTVTATPMHSFNVGALPSGESLRAAEAPLNKRVASLETLFGAVIADLHEFALELNGVQAKVLVQWNPVATYDDADVWAVVDAKTASGVPMRTALMEAGYTDEQVSEWYPEGESARSAKEIATLADAIQKLGAATTLGIISVDEARKLLPKDIAIEVLADPLAVLGAVDPAPSVSEGQDIKSKAEALGILIRAGVDPEEAATRVGLSGVEFTGAMPTSLRLPQADANKLEQA